MKYSKDGDGNYIDQFMMIRYPVVGPKVITAPKIIWTSQLEAKGFPQSSIGDSVVPNHTLIKRIEGDGDGDKIFLLTDPRLAKVQNEIVKFGTQNHIEFDVDNAKANDHQETDNMQDLWIETNFDTFRGKANIGDIDNRYSEFEQLVSMGAISKDVKNTPREDLDGNIIRYAESKEIAYMSDADYLRYLYGQTLQKAVDNKKVSLDVLSEKLAEHSGGYKIDESTAQQLYTRGTTGKQIKSIRNVQLDIDGNKVYLGSVGLIGSMPTKEQRDFMANLYGKAYKTITDAETRDKLAPGKKIIRGETLVLNEKEAALFHQFTTNFLVKDVRAANAIFKKQDFFNADKKQEIRKEILNQDPNTSEFVIDQEIRKREQKPFRNLPKEYDKAYQALKNLEAKYGEKVYNFGMMRTLRDMNGYFNQEWHSYDTELRSTVDSAIKKIAAPFATTPTINAYNRTASLKPEDLEAMMKAGDKNSKGDAEYLSLMQSNPVVRTLLNEFVKSAGDSRQEYAIRKKILSVIEGKIIRDARAEGKTKDEFIMPFFNSVDNVDKPVFALLSPQAK